MFLKNINNILKVPEPSRDGFRLQYPDPGVSVQTLELVIALRVESKNSQTLSNKTFYDVRALRVCHHCYSEAELEKFLSSFKSNPIK